MGNISSSTLFNFTDSIDRLINNLKQGIYCHNTLEKLPGNRHEYRVPMACFCDIPLSLISDHFEWYGSYGIGVKREYARELKAQPVHYITSENLFIKNLVKDKTFSEYNRKYLIPYLKKFSGDQLFPPSKINRRKKFYDEREWRFIPDPKLTEIYFGEKSIADKKEASQPKLRFPLKLKEIEYIIIENESDFEIIIPELRRISEQKNVKFETLIAKIITAKQIKKDF